MSSIAIDQNLTRISWKQMWSLTALYASIIIGWIAYQQYQPKLLVQFNFTDFALPLMCAEGAILTVTPLIAGRLGDRYRFTRGNRIPIISIGISFAAMVFMAVAFTLLGNPGEIVKWFLPVLIILWLIAMSIFTSPALSSIELFFPIEKLPRAMAILTITSNLLYALEPVVADIIDYLGAPITFVVGGLLVFCSGYLMKRNVLMLFSLNHGREDNPRAAVIKDSQRSEYAFIFFVGMVVGSVTTVMFNIFPDVLSTKLDGFLHDVNSKILLVGILIMSGILALPLSNLVSRFGTAKTFWYTSLLSVASISAVFFFSSPIMILLTIMIFSISFAALSVSSLPLAIARANYYDKVFCVGVFFSGVALPDAVVEVWLLI